MATTPNVDYQQLFHSLPENFLLIAPNAEATILDNTDSHAAASLKARDKVVGQPFFTAYPATNQREGDIIAESHEHVRQHKETHVMPLIRYDLERPAEQGGGYEERYWQATHYPMLDGQGELQYILQKAEDVTEQHLTQLRSQQIAAALAEEQERTHFILESLPVMIWTTSPNGTAESFNARWLAFAGIDEQETLGRDWLLLLHPDDAARVAKQWQMAVRNPALFQIEYRLRRHDGQYRWLLVRAIPRFTADGEVSMWIGCGIDMHDQKQMVEELLQTNEQQATLSDQAYQMQQQVTTQRDMFYSLFEQAPAIIAIARGPQHVHEFANPLYHQLFPDREILGRPVTEVAPEAVEQGFLAILDQVYQTGETFTGNEMMLAIQRPGQPEPESRYFNFIYQAYREHGRVVGITCFAFDVTDFVRVRQQLEIEKQSDSDVS